MHRNFSLNDDFNSSMACLNYSGLLTASQGEFQDLDKYEEHLIRRVAELIYVPHEEYIRAKLTVAGR